jgi:hypothetical protein
MKVIHLSTPRRIIVRLNKRSLGLARTATALAAVVLLVVLGNTDIAIAVAATAALIGMFSLRRYARIQLVYDNESAPAGEASVPAPGRKRQIADVGSIGDLAERMRGR